MVIKLFVTEYNNHFLVTFDNNETVRKLILKHEPVSTAKVGLITTTMRVYALDFDDVIRKVNDDLESAWKTAGGYDRTGDFSDSVICVDMPYIKRKS